MQLVFYDSCVLLLHFLLTICLDLSLHLKTRSLLYNSSNSFPSTLYNLFLYPLQFRISYFVKSLFCHNLQVYKFIPTFPNCNHLLTVSLTWPKGYSFTYQANDWTLVLLPFTPLLLLLILCYIIMTGFLMKRSEEDVKWRSLNID